VAMHISGILTPEKIVCSSTNDQRERIPWNPAEGRAETYVLVTGQLTSGIPFRFEAAKYWPAGTQRFFTLHFGTPNILRLTSGQFQCAVQLEGNAYDYVSQLFCAYARRTDQALRTAARHQRHKSRRYSETSCQRDFGPIAVLLISTAHLRCSGMQPEQLSQSVRISFLSHILQCQLEERAWCTRTILCARHMVSGAAPCFPHMGRPGASSDAQSVFGDARGEHAHNHAQSQRREALWLCDADRAGQEHEVCEQVNVLSESALLCEDLDARVIRMVCRFPDGGSTLQQAARTMPAASW